MPRSPGGTRLAVLVLVVGSIAATASAAATKSLLAAKPGDESKSGVSDDDEFEYDDVAGKISKVRSQKDSPSLSPGAASVAVPEGAQVQPAENGGHQHDDAGSEHAAPASVVVGATAPAGTLADGDCWPNCGAKGKGGSAPTISADMDCFPFCDKGKESKPAAPVLQLVSVASTKHTSAVPPQPVHQKGTIISEPIKSAADTWAENDDMRELEKVIGNAKGFKTFEQKVFPDQVKAPKQKYTPEQAQAWHDELEAFERLKKSTLHKLKKKVDVATKLDQHEQIREIRWQEVDLPVL